jgi:hypothetical protein
MINSFSKFLIEEERTVYFTFGRMNPPTIGHGKLIDKLSKTAGKNDYKIFVSQSADSKKNPLNYQSKIKHVRKMFPKHARNIMLNKKVKTAIDAAVSLYDQGYRNLVLVVGSDRINEFSVLLNKYNGKDGRHGFYKFQKINVVSAGERDPDAEGVEGMSASKQRQNAKENNFPAFAQGLPRSMNNAAAKALFNDVRKGMGLKESSEFKNHVQLEPVSDIREAFIQGNLFEVGQEVIIEKTNEVGTIQIIGSNYVIVESNGFKTRQWLDAITATEEYKYEWGTDASTKHAKKMTPGEKSEACWDSHKQVGMKKKGNKMVPNCVPKEAQDPDIKDREGSQPAAYHKGLSKAQKVARDRQFKRQAKMSDNDPSAYKPAPGDAKAKTKPSKHTLKFKQLYGEDAVQVAKAKIDREKQADSIKHDRILDRARIATAKAKNRATKP